jgi:glycosyltransferase involved in cell wall biosynthesis
MRTLVQPITILMPIKNGQEYLSQAIRDIEANLGPADEVIVVEDGSTDGTADLLRSWKRKQDKLMIINTGGKGLVHALNLGVESSSNDWIARFDVDDRYSPNRLKSQRKLLNANTAAVFCDYTFNSTKTSRLGWIPCAVTPDATTVSLISSQRTPHPGVIFNKFAVRDAGMYRNEDFPAEDLSLWLRLSKIGKLVGSPEKLLHYTLNPASVSSQQRELALQTKAKLLANDPIDVRVITRLLDSWEELLNSYESLDFDARRKVLLIRDLLLCRRAELIPNTHEKMLRRIELSILTNPQSYSETWRMFLESRARTKFRKSN